MLLHGLNGYECGGNAEKALGAVPPRLQSQPSQAHSHTPTLCGACPRKTDTTSSTVLDAHPDRECETGLKFEDPTWRQRLALLKSAILLDGAAKATETRGTDAA
jgi:hypothetical protein